MKMLGSTLEKSNVTSLLPAELLYSNNQNSNTPHSFREWTISLWQLTKSLVDSQSSSSIGASDSTRHGPPVRQCSVELAMSMKLKLFTFSHWTDFFSVDLSLYIMSVNQCRFRKDFISIWNRHSKRWNVLPTKVRLSDTKQLWSLITRD